MDSPTGIYYLSGSVLKHSTTAILSISDIHVCSLLQKVVIDFDLTSNSYISIMTRDTLTRDGIDISDIKSHICYRCLTATGTIGSRSICGATVDDGIAAILAYETNAVFEDCVKLKVMNSNDGGNDSIC